MKSRECSPLDTTPATTRNLTVVRRIILVVLARRRAAKVSAVSFDVALFDFFLEPPSLHWNLNIFIGVAHLRIIHILYASI